MASGDHKEPKINVKDVCKKFLLKSDEQLANKLQTEEYFDHTKKNRFLKQTNRENIRKSIPLVESIQTDEQKLQSFLKNQNNKLKQLETNDQVLAFELQQKYLEEIQMDQFRRDEELAKKLQQEEILTDSLSQKEADVNQNIYEESYYHDPDDDFSLAMYLQQQEQGQVSREALNDEELARRLQYSENSRLSGNLYSQNSKTRIISIQNLSDYNSLGPHSLASSWSSTALSSFSLNSNNYSRLFVPKRQIDDPRLVKCRAKMSYNYDSLNSSNKYTDHSYEEDSLIETLGNSKSHLEKKAKILPDPKPDSKENVCDSKKGKEKKIKNVIAKIDPTFPKSTDSSNSNDPDQMDSVSTGSAKGKKNGYSSLGDNDTEIFLPIQGQKRGTIKSIKKKRSHTQCLQQ
ncbi:hypothetical protein BpHYR1_013715 [Brachionus plicatilis]|uniref:Coiled-coil domain-containing protein n=1 Tax=Brachionus plicatilis TaxID=10195 RepID=A0A3M7PB72_BRAPC|nr:hypothetical protein BpHYR1_013715 [Brachionus plicatilis]